MVAEILVGPGLVTRRVRANQRDIVFIKGVFEASEGVGILFAHHDGSVVLAAPVSRAAELDELIDDLAGELTDLVLFDDEDGAGVSA